MLKGKEIRDLAPITHTNRYLELYPHIHKSLLRHPESRLTSLTNLPKAILIHSRQLRNISAPPRPHWTVPDADRARRGTAKNRDVQQMCLDVREGPLRHVQYSELRWCWVKILSFVGRHENSNDRMAGGARG
jgi:hypothetical protein